MKIYTLGPDKSFSSLGAKKFCLENKLDPAKISFKNSFVEIWEKLKSNPENFAVLPIENTSSSNVHENIDAVFDNQNIQIFAEFYLQINLHLIGLKGAKKEEIETIYSHLKAFAQCKKFLENFAGNTINTESTSQAFEILNKKSDQKSAIIGGKYLVGDSHGCSAPKNEILAKNIANQANNFTRFVLVGAQSLNSSEFELKNKNKATLIFETKHEAGALAKILTTISLLNGNLLKIESRPIPEKPYNYSFWIDIDLTGTPENLFKILAKNLHSLRVVGVYPAGSKLVV